MTPAEFRCTRELLGLPVDWLADHLGVSVRSVARWEAGTHPIPDGVAAEVLMLSDEASGLVSQAADRFEPESRIATYRTDADIGGHVVDPSASGGRPASHMLSGDGRWIVYPASWHRAICARIADQVPGVRIEYV